MTSPIMKNIKQLLKEHDEAKFVNFDQKKLEQIDLKLEKLRQQLQKDLGKKASTSTPFISYPEFNDPEFFNKIFAKKEFNKTIAPPVPKNATFDEIANSKCNPTSFRLTNNQVFNKNYMSVQTPYNGLLLFHGVGVGKCFAPNTPILMYNGMIKTAEYITLNDQVMGDDSTPRKVLTLARGCGLMFRICPDPYSSADAYTVNADHILCLKQMLPGNRGFKKVTLSVMEYLCLTEDEQALLFGYQNNHVFFKTRNYNIFTDEHLAHKYGFLFMQKSTFDYNILGGDTITRASFITGYIDMYGKLTVNNSIRVPYDYKVMVVARSLGIRVATDAFLTMDDDQSNETWMYFHGNALRRLDHSNCPLVGCIKPKSNPAPYCYKFTIIPLGLGEYYGFSVDKNHQFLLGDCTVTHNSCTAITIAEQFANVFPKKCLVLSPKSLKGNFRQQIFSRKKGLQQCTGNTYLKHIQDDQLLSEEALDRKVDKIIDTKYAFMGFQEFANHVIHLETGSKGKSRYITKIKREFSDRVIIIDEVHNVREDDKRQKIVPPKLLEVIQHAERVKLILLSATPMYNEAVEIVWLLNLLLANDNRPQLVQSEIFTKEGELTDAGPAILEQAAKGYISYMRGENPFSFPLRFYPSINDTPSKSSKIKISPTHDIKGELIPVNMRLSKLELFTSYMSDYQENIYNALLQLGDYEKKTNTIFLEASNIVYPGKKNNIGSEGFANAFIVSKSTQMSYRDESLPFLSMQHLGTYSPKIKSIVENILTSLGLVYVYSYYYHSGIIPLAIALEHAGFARHGGSNLLSTTKPIKKFIINGKQATYTIIGNKPYTTNFEAEVNAIRATSNARGEDIKVIIGSSLSVEGIDFKFIRQVHVLEPWYNLNKFEQLVGRAQRNCSHIALPVEERNVTIYFHVNRIKKSVNESIDERAYRLAENKQDAIDQVEAILTSNAVDCPLNENALFFDVDKINLKINVITSQNKVLKNWSVGDKMGDKYFRPKKQICKHKKGSNVTRIDTSTFSRAFHLDEIEASIPTISTLFLQDSTKSLTYEQIRAKIPKSAIGDDVLMFALDYMLTQKTPIDKHSYLLYRSNMYMLQPILYSDTRIPIKDRGPVYKPMKQKMVNMTATTQQQRTNTTTNATANANAVANAVIAAAANATTKTVDAIAQLINDVNTIKADLGFTGPKYDAVIYDYIIDRIDVVKLKALATQLLAKPNKHILTSLVKGQLFIPEHGWIRDPAAPDTWYKVLTGTTVSPREIANAKIPDIQSVPLRTVKGYLMMDYSKGVTMPKFKIIDEAKTLSLGFVCSQTSTFTAEKVHNAIIEIDDSLDQGKSLKKKDKCIMYELVLRHAKPRMFARPLEVRAT